LNLKSVPSLDVDQSTCTAPGGGVKETKQYFEEEGEIDYYY